MADSSLVKLSVSAIVHQDGSFLDRCDLSSLPRNLLQELLVSSISYSRILSLKSLITNWPLEHLLLRNVVGFDEPKAVLLAYWLQRTKHNLKLVDMTGCNIGLQGTRAFCKLAINLRVSDNDVSGMKILDMRPAVVSLKPDVTTEFPRQRNTTTVVMLDAIVDYQNCCLAMQACNCRFIMDLEMSHVTFREVGSVREINFLLKSLKPEITTGLDLTRNDLREQGIMVISPAIMPLTNLTELNLSYNNLYSRDTNAIQEIANICSNLTKLKKLDLSGNYIKAGVGTILRCLTSNLTHLALGGCGVEEEILREMCLMENLRHLQSLKLYSSGLANCLDLLCNFILRSAKTLEYLSIEENMFVSSSVAPLCQMIQQLHLLKKLSLCYNHFLPDDITTFREMFPALEIINRDWLY